jgi:hypothetical protein
MKIVIDKKEEPFFNELGISSFRTYGPSGYLIFGCRLNTYRKMSNKVGEKELMSHYKFVV